MGLIQFFRILYARRAIFLATLIGCFVVAAVMSQVLPKRYAAHARVWLDVIKPDPVTGQVLSNPTAYALTQIEIIRDYQVAGKVVDQLGWANDPAMLERYARQTGGQGGDIRRWIAKTIIDSTDAKLIAGSNILEITYRASHPELARQVVTLLRDVYKNSTAERQQQSAGSIADWYAEQVQRAEALVRIAEAERARFAKEHAIVLQADSTDLESSRLKALSGQTAIEFVPPAMPAPITQTSPAEMQLGLLRQQIAQSAEELGPNHPRLRALELQRDTLEAAVGRERASATRTIPSTAGNAAARAAAAYERQKGRVVAQSEQIDMLNRMTRDIELKRDQLAKVAEKASEYRLQASSGDNEIRPMGDAIAPDSPESPNVALILAGAIGFGSALGICLSLLVEFLGRRVRGWEDLEYASGAPVFAEISSRLKNKASLPRKLVNYLSERARRSRLPAGAR
jgi:uncharacterized protein involved in exopolysaccharide biosynthesis